MVHNTVQAAKTIGMRRQQIASKWLGPPCHNDPEYSTDPDSGDEEPRKPEKEPELPELDIPAEKLTVPPVPSINFAPFNEIDGRALFPRAFNDNLDMPKLPESKEDEPEIPKIVIEKPDADVGETVIDRDEDVVDLDLEVPYLYGEIPLP